jgi:hypothetical protein
MHLERAAIPAAVERALATSKPQIANLFSQSESQQLVPWQGVDVEDLVRAQLAHFADLVSFRIAVHGPRLRLNPASAQAIGLALHAIVIKAKAERGVSGAVDFEYARHWRDLALDLPSSKCLEPGWKMLSKGHADPLVLASH